MVKSLSNVLVVATMLIAFVGQALAYASMSSCEMSIDSLESPMNMDLGSMTHSNMNHADMGHESMLHGGQQNHEECCGSDCVCPASACMSISIVASEPHITYLAGLSESAYYQPISQTKSIPTALFRPPIFA